MSVAQFDEVIAQVQLASQKAHVAAHNARRAQEAARQAYEEASGARGCAEDAVHLLGEVYTRLVAMRAADGAL